AAPVFPYSIGDAHLENFGTLQGRDGTLAIEANDLDSADRYPYLVEVRRLAISVVVATRLSNADDEDARAIAIASQRDNAYQLGRSYAETIAAIAEGAEREPQLGGGGSPVLLDLFERAQEDLVDRSELSEVTTVEDGKRRLVRGSIDEDAPENLYADAPPIALDALPATIERYRATIADPPPAEFFALKDAVREFGSGVASWPRARFILLVEGPTTELDDDVLLEVKEIGDSGARPASFTGVSSDDIGARVLRARTTCWTRSDAEPLWGMSELLGLTVQIKRESKAEKSLRVRRLEEDEGTPEAMAALSTDLGRFLANVHAGSESLEPGTVAAIAHAIGDDIDAFANEQADAAVAYADIVIADHARFVHALETLGPTLGTEPTEGDGYRDDVADLIGEPPEGAP
ncbi:MAG: DUF2252 family protein, partial [Myxococcales bacterium]|nr:DUF2252 family protein [Myxococcales bacterium]